MLHALEHESDLLKGNHFGDPHRREVQVYTPPGYEGEPLPALLALAGFGGSGFGFTNRSWRARSLPERMDHLIAQGMPPALVVMPDVLTCLGGGQYLDTPTFGPYGSWLVQELLPWVDGRFPVSAWGVMGKSSGGYGSLVLAMQHPGVFRGLAAHAPDSGFEYACPPDFPKAVEDLRAAGGLQAWLDEFRGGGELKGPDHGILNLLAMSCCYSPRMDASPLPCDLPVDLETGETRPEVFARWLDFDPVRMLPGLGANLANVSVWLDVGRRDEFRLQVGARMLHRELLKTPARLHYEEHDGGHFRMNGRFEFSLPWLVSALVT